MTMYDESASRVQKLVLRRTKNSDYANNWKPERESESITRLDGIEYVNDIKYSDSFPNSYFDIWFTKLKKASKGTIVYLHGGGFLFGDKLDGDPLAMEGDGDLPLLVKFAEQGYNVISANYCLSPEYRFPDQVTQLNELVELILRKGSMLGLNTNKILLMGSSAGAIIVLIYGTLLSNESYAKKLGINSNVKSSCISGLIIDEAAVDTSSFDNNMATMLGCWIGEDDIIESENARLLDVNQFITAAFPSTFLVSSNHEPYFFNSNVKLEQRLNDIGCLVKHFYIDNKEAVLKHGFLKKFAKNKIANECFGQILEFIENS